jgi:hypothetical protein
MITAVPNDTSAVSTHITPLSHPSPRNSILFTLTFDAAAPKRPVPHRDIYSNETLVTTAITPTIAVNNRRIESETESLSPDAQSSTAPPPPPTTGGTQEPEQSSTTATPTDDPSSTEVPIIANSPDSKEVKDEPSESSISGQRESSTPVHSADLTTGTPVSTEATTSSGHESSDKSTTISSESGTSAIPIDMKVGPEERESGSTSSSSPKLGSSVDITSTSEAPVSVDEKKESEFPTTAPQSDGTESEFLFLMILIARRFLIALC